MPDPTKRTGTLETPNDKTGKARATLTIKSRPRADGSVSWFLWIRRPRPERDELIPVTAFTKLSDRPAVEAFAKPYRKALQLALTLPELSCVNAPASPGVYFVQQGDRVKIGKASNIRQRLLSGATFAAYGVKLLAWQQGGLREESELHRRFHDLRVRGEWFRFRGELREYVLALRKEQAA